MKSRIFMYLFIFSVLLIIFQFVNSKHILESYETDIKKEKARVANYKDSIAAMIDENSELKLFNLDYDDDALDYFIDKGYDVSQLIPFIKDELYKLNEYEGDDHPIVPYASMTNNKILINNVRLLNHKWLIANFTDGKHWGQIFLTYAFEGEQLKFKLVEFFMYPLN
ncbi:hydrolase [Subsaxibacter sp. CAU 1640]|uniref:hydrolase n=1 Tax=Subsaxibacter sp. CAU 1640 TaxID=2933271 RepID=UPI00200419EF|nr:hydrolase [Subsaxibacter sp. CAU 1640]MCK7591153.1 hydrolase [Subsaxibacter sp. CAU 1640]